jgi:hypothetical protein
MIPFERNQLRQRIDQAAREKTLVGLCPICLTMLPKSPTKPRKFCSKRCAGRGYELQALKGPRSEYLLGKCG